MVAATLLGSAVFIKLARATALTTKASFILICVAVPLTFLGAHVMYVVFDEPGTFFVFGGISSFGALATGIGILCGYALFTDQAIVSLFGWLDIATYAAIYAAPVARMGCFLAHDHIGVRTTFWLSVRFPDGDRFDLGLLELLFLLSVAIFVALSHHLFAKKDGLLFGAVGLCYGCFRLCLERLRESPELLYGLTAEQWGALLLVVLSAGCLVVTAWSRRKSRVRPATNRENQFIGSS